jgi:acetyl esterase/lipase
MLRIGLLTTLLGTASSAAQGENSNAKKPSSTTPADMTNVVYGSDQKVNVLDLWKAKSDQPTPLVIFIHGGGGIEGRDKSSILTQFPLDELLEAGISCASIDYRKETNGKIYFPKPVLDSARAVQFLRSKAREFNFDPARFACSARGAGGAGIALLIAFHQDLADPKSDDPVARESTRLACVAVEKAVVSYDLRWIKKNVPGKAWRGPNLAAIFGVKEDELLAPPPEKARLMEENAAINYLTAAAPPVFVSYPGENLSLKTSADVRMIDFGLALKEKMDALKVECEVVGGWPQKPESTGPDKTDVEFLLRHFGRKQ